jgi:probable rRNA maturation factor
MAVRKRSRISSADHSLDIQFASRLHNLPSEAEFMRWMRAALDQAAQVTIRVVNAAEARNLNSTFRGRNYPTNVLTFIYHDQGSNLLQGDIVLCAPIVAREAREQRKKLAHHYAHLTVHGALHLAGYDHEQQADAENMEATEAAILASLGIPDPYSIDSSIEKSPQGRRQ